MQNHDDEGEEEPIKDLEARKHLQVLSSRLYDLKERFVKIVHKINADLNDYTGQISSDEDSSIDDESTNEESGNEADAKDASSVDEDNEQKQKCLIQYILRSKARRIEYLKHVTEYPKIMEYLIDEKSDCTDIPLQYLEPFVQNHVDKNPTSQIYDQIIKQMKDIRLNYFKKS